jgi:competence protein ComGF
MKGYTLVEMLICLAVTMLVSTLVIGCLFGVNRKAWSINEAIEIRQITRFIQNRLWQDIQKCDKVLPESNAGQLKLYLNGKIITYDYYNKKIRRITDGQTSYLTEDGQIDGMQYQFNGNLIEISIWRAGKAGKMLICRRHI